MKLNLIITLFLIYNIEYSFSQEIFNPYVNSVRNSDDITITDVNLQAVGAIYYPAPNEVSWFNRDNVAAYYGEYEIDLTRHPWQDYDLSSFTPLNWSYSMETVSFPFYPECSFLPSGCSALMNTNTRPLGIPDPSLMPFQNDAWGSLTNKFYHDGASGHDQALASIRFLHSTPWLAAAGGVLLPHTVIKHTVYLHCESPSASNPNPAVITSFSWIYDNTRGRMKYYPFCNCNCISGLNGCDMTTWDIVFAPEVLMDVNGHNYSKTDNTAVFGYKSLNYNIYTQSGGVSPCSGISYVINPYQSDDFMSGLHKIYLPPYTLLTAPALSHLGNSIAGYSKNQFLPQIDLLPGLEHAYNLNYNLAVTDINSQEQCIYNPSDVSISADNFIFPSNYVFKTIRGVYPSEAEVLLDNIVEYGGTWSDLRDVPVRTDLRCEDPAFDHDPLNPLHSRYASLYRLESGSKLTIEPCVSVFDAAFILNEGSTLDFSNFQTFIGYWEDNASLSRVAIDRNGGKLIRRYNNSLINSTLYLQDRIETEIAPNSYIVDNKIIAGANVIPSPGGTVGPYIADVNSNVELIAKNYVKLDVGFAARAGSNVKIATDPFMVIAQCPPPASGGSGNRVSSFTAKNEVEMVSVKLQPTVFDNLVEVISSSSTSGIILNIEVLDNTGRLVKNFNNINSINVEFDLNDLPVGMYLFKVQTEKSVEVLKGVKN